MNFLAKRQWDKQRKTRDKRKFFILIIEDISKKELKIVVDEDFLPSC